MSVSNKSNTVIRALGSIETRMALFHGNLNGSTQGTQTIDFEADIDASIFYEAVNALYKKYVPLRCTIKREDNELYFYRDADLNRIDVNYIEVNTIQEKDKLVRLALDDKIEASISLWKISLVKLKSQASYTLIFSAHHAIIDANGMHHIAQSFFDFIASKITGTNYFDNTEVDLPLAVDALLREQTFAPKAEQTTARDFDTACPLESRSTHWQQLKLDTVFMGKLNTQLAKDNIKFHSIVSAAMCIAMQKTQFIQTPFPFGTAVSLRFLQDSQPSYFNPLGCYMSIASNLIEGSELDVTQLAIKYDRALMHKIMTTCLTKSPIDINQVDAGTKQIATLHSFAQGVGITNMGDINIRSPHPSVLLTDYTMLANRVAGNFSIVAHCYAFNNVQTVSLVYPHPILAGEHVKEVVNEMRLLLEDYCAQANTNNSLHNKTTVPA